MKKTTFYKLTFVFVVFVFSVTLRMWHLNDMGRTWDESAQVVDGYHFIQLIKQGDFNNKYFYDHPYHPPLTKYVYGLAAQLDSEKKINTHPIYRKGEPLFSYDLFYSHLVSVLFGSASVIFVILIGWEYVSPFVGITSGIIFALLPFFIGLSQIASIESVLMFFFNATIYSFFKFLHAFSKKTVVVTGILLGLSVATKYSNALLYPLFLWIYFIWCFNAEKNKKKAGVNKRLFYMLGLSFLTIFVLWPQPWFHLQDVIAQNYKLRVVDTQHSIPEVFFGKLIFVPKVYYIIMFLITTPALLLLVFSFGLVAIGNWNNYISILHIQRNIFQKGFLKKIISVLHHFFFFTKNKPVYKIHMKNKWVLYSLVIWFAFPFVQSLYNFRQHGVRYIIEIYAPFSLIAALGFDHFVSMFTNSLKKKIVFFIPVFLYLSFILWQITPYYLDYFNEVVGGNRSVYEKRLFQLGWWGEGIKEASEYVDTHAKPGSTVGLAVVPLGVVPPLKHVRGSEYNSSKRYDYVLVSYFNIVREGFDDSNVVKNYKEVYFVDANGAKLVTVYKHK